MKNYLFIDNLGIPAIRYHRNNQVGICEFNQYQRGDGILPNANR